MSKDTIIEFKKPEEERTDPLTDGCAKRLPGSTAGEGCQGLSAGTISRLKDRWRADLAKWQQRDLDKKRYVYFWADGVYFNIRGDEARQCILL